VNPLLERLQPYPFERLRDLLDGVEPPADLAPIALSIGEPRHAPPAFIGSALAESLEGLGRYPKTAGEDALRRAIADWLERRFRLSAGAIDPASMVLPVNGTREGLFSFVQACIDPQADSLVMMPNPGYQIYEGATLLGGATPRYLNTDGEHGHLPDLSAVPPDEWRRCSLLFLCSPANPTGAVLGQNLLAQAIELAHRYDFMIAADECYSEIYADEEKPPPGLLQICAETGREDFRRCVVFHSLSKRSSVPGLRSGFVAGDAAALSDFQRYRTYHGCAMGPPNQQASIAAWQDEEHVIANRELYRQKFDAVLPILSDVLGVTRPAGSFYLWARTPIDDKLFCRELFATRHVTAVPGSYLSRQTPEGDPGAGYIRLSLVADLDTCVEAARRIRSFCHTLT
jgi:N-succinyldiaminopimelate aminotransferase